MDGQQQHENDEGADFQGGKGQRFGYNMDVVQAEKHRNSHKKLVNLPPLFSFSVENGEDTEGQTIFYISTNSKKVKENEKTHRSRQLEDEHYSCRGRRARKSCGCSFS